jgi:transposase
VALRAFSHQTDVSTLADWVGACSATLALLVELIRRHVLAATRIHGDDTTVPVLAKNKTVTGRLWTYVRDDQPFGGSDPPAAMFFYSRDRGCEHPRRHLSGWVGTLQADAYAGSMISTTPSDDPAGSPKRRAGPTAGASSLCWPI